MALTHDEMREMARAARQPYFIDADRINNPTDRINNPILIGTPDVLKKTPILVDHAPDVLKKTPILVDHAVHDMYKIEPGSKVFVANIKMVLKGHITKKVTIFSREQLVIGEKMKHWLPFEFGGGYVNQATPIQLFDLGYYVFETDNAKWPHMIVPKSLFEPNDQSMELQEIQKELDKLHAFKQALKEDDARANFEQMQDQDEENDKNIKAMLNIWMANDESMGVVEIDEPVIPPLTEKQQKALTKKQVCPDCKGANLDTLQSWLSQGPKMPAVTVEGGSHGALVPQEVYCRNCASKFAITGYGGFGATRI